MTTNVKRATNFLNGYLSFATSRIIGLLFVMIFITVTGCAPQHHHAFKQFNTESRDEIISIQGYVADSSDAKELGEAWNLLIAEMSKKPGFVSGYLSEGVGDSKLVLAHSTWENLESLRNAFSDKKILELESKLPKIQFEHLFNVGTLANYQGKTEAKPMELYMDTTNSQGVTLINSFEVPIGKLEESIKYWEACRDFLENEPGYISTKLHRSIKDNAKFQLVNVAIWESPQAFMKASKRMGEELGVPPTEGLIPNASLYSVIRN